MSDLPWWHPLFIRQMDSTYPITTPPSYKGSSRTKPWISEQLPARVSALPAVLVGFNVTSATSDASVLLLGVLVVGFRGVSTTSAARVLLLGVLVVGFRGVSATKILTPDDGGIKPPWV